MASLTIVGFKQQPDMQQNKLVTVFICYSKDAFNGLAIKSAQELQAFINNGNTITNIQNNNLNDINSMNSLPLYNANNIMVDRQTMKPVTTNRVHIFLLEKRITKRGNIFDYVQMVAYLHQCKANSLPEVSFLMYKNMNNIEKVNYKYVTKDDKTFVALKEGELPVVDETVKQTTVQPSVVQTQSSAVAKPVSPQPVKTAPQQIVAQPTQPVKPVVQPVAQQPAQPVPKQEENKGRTFTREELSKIRGVDLSPNAKNPLTPYEKRQWWNYRAEIKIFDHVAEVITTTIVSSRQPEDRKVYRPNQKNQPSRSYAQYYTVLEKILKPIITEEEYEGIKKYIRDGKAQAGIDNFASQGSKSVYQNSDMSKYVADEWWYIVQYLFRNPDFVQTLKQYTDRGHMRLGEYLKYERGVQKGRVSELLVKDDKIIPEFKQYIKENSLTNVLSTSRWNITDKNTFYTIEPIKSYNNQYKIMAESQEFNPNAKYDYLKFKTVKTEAHVFHIGHSFDDVNDYINLWNGDIKNFGYILFVKWCYVLANQLQRNYDEDLQASKIKDSCIVASLLYAKAPEMYKLMKKKLAKQIKDIDANSTEKSFTPHKTLVDEFSKKDIKVQMIDINTSKYFAQRGYYQDTVDPNMSVVAINYDDFGIKDKLNNKVFGQSTDMNNL